MIEYYLLKCEIYDKERDELRKKDEDDEMRLEKLLDDSKKIRSTIQFIENTNRFNS